MRIRTKQPLRFFLGTHKPGWLATAGVPLFVSRRSLAPVRELPRAVAPWALDSGGFTELSMHGGWTLSARDYAAEVRRFRDEVGSLEWAAPQDWMCEPPMLKRTGLTVAEHQRRTIENFLELRTLASDLPIAPVLQGWTSWEYLEHFEAYERAGVDLRREPIVGVGTVCRRQGTMSASNTLAMLSTEGLRLHGFGFKTNGLRASASKLASSDSLAWSFNARKRPAMAGHTHANCSNCLEFALEWRRDLLASVPGVV